MHKEDSYKSEEERSLSGRLWITPMTPKIYKEFKEQLGTTNRLISSYNKQKYNFKKTKREMLSMCIQKLDLYELNIHIYLTSYLNNHFALIYNPIL